MTDWNHQPRSRSRRRQSQEKLKPLLADYVAAVKKFMDMPEFDLRISETPEFERTLEAFHQKFLDDLKSTLTPPEYDNFMENWRRRFGIDLEKRPWIPPSEHVGRSNR
jgi:hypothetical protein